MILEYYMIRPGVEPPVRSNPSDAGLDVRFNPESGEPLIIAPGESKLLQTGIKIGIPHGYVVKVENRSGLASKKSLIVGSCVTGDTLIQTNKGKFPAYQLDKKFIKNNDLMILSFNTKNANKEYKNFDGFRINGKKQLVEIELENGNKLIAAEDHFVLTSTRGYVPLYLLTEQDDLILV